MKPKVSDIANMTGVSSATVSNALNDISEHRGISHEKWIQTWICSDQEIRLQ